MCIRDSSHWVGNAYCNRDHPGVTDSHGIGDTHCDLDRHGHHDGYSQPD